MILEATVTDVEIEYKGKTCLFHDVAFFARIMATHAMPPQFGAFEDDGQPDDFEVVSIYLDPRKDELICSMAGALEGLTDHLCILEGAGRLWLEVADLIKQSLTDRIHAGEWDDEIRNG